VRLALATLLVLSLPVGVAAAETRTGGTVVVEADETVSEDLTATAGTVVVRGTVDGDLDAFAGNVIVTGTVTGDVRAFAGNVRIAGNVGGSVEAAGGNVFVEDGAEIAGDLQAAAGVVAINGSVAGTARVGSDELTVGPSAVVGGDLLHSAASPDVADGARVDGQIRQVEDVGEPRATPLVPGWVSAVYGFLVNLVVGVLLVALLRGFSDSTAARFVERPLTALGVGLLALVGVPALLVVLAITIVGIPFALVGALLYALALWLGYVYGAFAVGAWLIALAGEDWGRIAALALGLAAVTVLGLVPVLGGIVQFVVLLLGLGALTGALYDRWRSTEPEWT
jgi:cytoskeletal protein CcmA (bactofilin family)